MDLIRFGELCDYWAKRPPVHVSVAIYLQGDSGKGSAARAKPGDEGLTGSPGELMELFPERR